MANENIKFEFWLDSQYWNSPPIFEIKINGISKYKGSAENHGTNYVSFGHALEFNHTYLIHLIRQGKDHYQVRTNDDGSIDDQILSIDKIKIDGINMQNFIYKYSWNEPDYPEPWASEQRNLGIELEERVYSETNFGHNGIWNLSISSPFYQFILQKAAIQ